MGLIFETNYLNQTCNYVLLFLGMSQIAALLLMYLIDEEDAFWALSQLMVDNKYAMHGKYVRYCT